MTDVREIHRRLAEQFVARLRQGLSIDRIAATVAVGLCLAVFPVVGMTTLLCFLAAWAFRLNQPIIQTVNWSSYALQLILIIPFIRLGERLFHGPRLLLSLKQLVALAKADPVGTIASISAITGHAVVAWAIVAPFAGLLVFLALRPLVRALCARIPAREGDMGNVA